MKGYNFDSAVRLTRASRFLYPTRWLCSGAIVPAFLLAGQSEPLYSGVWIPIKEDSEKGIDRLKAGSADRILEVLATLFATTATLPRFLNLTVPSNISLLKTDSKLTVIASQLIFELRALLVVIIVMHDFLIIVL